MNTPLLEVEDLAVSFRMYEGGLKQKDVQVISSLQVTVWPGQITAIVGSSGSGKSLLAHAILGILPPHATVTGRVRCRGEAATKEDLQTFRGKEIALIPQSVNYLDPLMKVGPQVQGATVRSNRDERKRRQKEAFARLGLPDKTEKLYPFQLSGGMARRALVSTAMVSGANLIIADEPTPGMSIEQALEALTMLRELADAGAGIILITHDIDLASQFADTINVFYGGRTLEVIRAKDFLEDPSRLRHPYTKALWRALPQHDFVALPGSQPAPGQEVGGCVFSPRCPIATEECFAMEPPVTELPDGMVRCFHAS